MIQDTIYTLVYIPRQKRIEIITHKKMMQIHKKANREHDLNNIRSPLIVALKHECEKLESFFDKKENLIQEDVKNAIDKYDEDRWKLT